MNLKRLKFIYFASCALIALIILSPTLASVIILPNRESFSELWLLGPTHLTENYPFDIKAGQVYSLYLGFRNRMSDIEYYRVFVKFRNQTESLPDIVNGMPSDLNPLLEYRVFLNNDEAWEKQISFSVVSASLNENSSRISQLAINGNVLNKNSSATWDEANRGFYYQLFFELWRFDPPSASFQFHDRFVGLWLNMTGNV